MASFDSSLIAFAGQRWTQSPQEEQRPAKNLQRMEPPSWVSIPMARGEQTQAQIPHPRQSPASCLRAEALPSGGLPSGAKAAPA